MEEIQVQFRVGYAGPYLVPDGEPPPQNYAGRLQRCPNPAALDQLLREIKQQIGHDHGQLKEEMHKGLFEVLRSLVQRGPPQLIKQRLIAGELLTNTHAWGIQFDFLWLLWDESQAACGRELLCHCFKVQPGQPVPRSTQDVIDSLVYWIYRTFDVLEGRGLKEPPSPACAPTALKEGLHALAIIHPPSAADAASLLTAVAGPRSQEHVRAAVQAAGLQHSASAV